MNIADWVTPSCFPMMTLLILHY